MTCLQDHLEQLVFEEDVINYNPQMEAPQITRWRKAVKNKVIGNHTSVAEAVTTMSRQRDNMEVSKLMMRGDLEGLKRYLDNFSASGESLSRPGGAAALTVVTLCVCVCVCACVVSRTSEGSLVDMSEQCFGGTPAIVVAAHYKHLHIVEYVRCHVGPPSYATVTSFQEPLTRNVVSILLNSAI